MVVTERRIALYAFWELGSYAKLDEDLLQEISHFDYRNMPMSEPIARANIVRFFENASDLYLLSTCGNTHVQFQIPPERRKKIFQPYSLPFWRELAGRKNPTDIAFVLGRGDKKRGITVASYGLHELCRLPVGAL